MDTTSQHPPTNDSASADKKSRPRSKRLLPAGKGRESGPAILGTQKGAGRTIPVLVSLLVVVSILGLVIPALTATPTGSDGGETLVVDDDYDATDDLPLTNGTACKGASFGTIQDAVDAASPDDTVRVCAGTYNESVTVDTADLTVRAAGQARIQFTGWVVRINASGVTVTGFDLYADSIGGGVIVHANDTLVQNNSIHAATVSGVYVPGPSTEDVLVRNNMIDNAPTEEYPPDGITINGTATVRGNTVVHANEGIDVLGTALVVNNTVSRSENGIDISHGHARIINNTARNNYNAGVLFSHSFVGKNPYPNASGVVVGNRLVNNRDGVIVATYKTDPSNYAVHRNVIMNNANFGIEVGNYNVLDNDTRILNATNNYWGCGGPSGGLEDPHTGRVANGSGDPISASDDLGVANVHFDPFKVHNPSSCTSAAVSLTPTPTPTSTAQATAKPTPTATATATPATTPTSTPVTTRGSVGDASGDGTGAGGGSDDTDSTGGDEVTDGTGGVTVPTPALSTTTRTPTPPPSPTLSPTPITEPGFGLATWVLGAGVVGGLLALRRRGG